MSQVLVSIGAIQILIMFVALVRAKVLSVILGPAGYGIVSTVDQTVLSVMQLGALSLPFTALKFMARRHSDGHDEFEQTYTSFFRALAALSVVAVVVVGAILYVRPGIFGRDLTVYRNYFYVAMLGVPAAMLNVLFVNTLAAAQRGAASAMMNMLVLLAAAIASVIGVVLGGIGGLYVATVSTGACCTLASIWYLRKSLRLRLTAPTHGLFAELRQSPEIVSYSAMVYVALSAYSLTMLATRYFVFAALGAVGAGLLQALLSIALTVGAVMTPMNGLFLTPLVNRNLPVATKVDAANDFAGKILVLLLLGGVAVALFPATALTVLFSRRFVDGAGALYLFVVWQCLYQIVNVYLQLLIGLDDVAFYTVTTCVGYGVAALLFAPLVAHVGLGGAALSLGSAMIVAAIAASVRLRSKFGAGIRPAVWIRSAYCLLAIAAAGFFFSPATEARPLGVALRLLYALAVTVLLWLTLDSSERALVGAGIAWGQRKIGVSARSG